MSDSLDKAAEERAEIIAADVCPGSADGGEPCSDCIRQVQSVLSVIESYGWRIVTGTEWADGWVRRHEATP